MKLEAGTRPAVVSTTLWMLTVLMLSLPGITWLSTVGNPADYWMDGIPQGQTLYLLSKLAGLYALIAFWMQLMYGAMGQALRTKLGLEFGLLFHQKLAGVVVFLVLAHASLFVAGVTIRTHHFASQYLTPSFSSGYYRSAITYGISAAAMLLPVIVAGFGRRWIPAVWRYVHWLAGASCILAFAHSLSIGSESRLSPMSILYWIMTLLALGAVGYRVIGRPKVRSQELAGTAA